MDHVRWLSRPTLRNPFVVAAFTGWNDAGDSASATVRHLVEQLGATPLAEIDPEEFTDFATVRPHVRLTNERKRRIVWPTVGLWSVSTPGADLVLVLGPEPAMRWRLFTEQIIGVAQSFESRAVVTLGALLADVAHSRPVQIIGTATDQDLIDRYDLQPSRYEGPTGIVGVLQDAADAAGMAPISLWAAVPAYASQIPSPKAALALVERLGSIIGTQLPTTSLDSDVRDYEGRVTALVDEDDDLAGYVRRLESMSDAGIDGFDDDDEADDDEDDDDTSSSVVELPDNVDSGALIDEVERFLRDQ